jgi:hypothetical protein
MTPLKPLGHSNSRIMIPRMPSWVRYVMFGVIVAVFVYAFVMLNAVEQADSDPDILLEKIIVVPELDADLLATTRDKSRSDRLHLDAEPLRHLLAEAIDVGPSVAAALQIPAEMVPVEDLRENVEKWRHRWLWYEGKLTSISGPRKGHPIDGYSIHDAIIELQDGNSVMVAFSVEPKEQLKVGDWVRAEGYYFKLRDLTYPNKLDKVPMLVGRTIERDYEDWPKVTKLDQSLFEGFDDSSFWPTDLPARTVEEDQTEVLWHLGAFVRDTAEDWTFSEWRQVEPLSVAEPYDRLREGEVGRGEPMRIFGTLIRRSTIAAPANPANIKFWTTAWLQVHSFGGHLIPVWIPKRVDELPMRAQLEVRGFFYRWLVYDGADDRFRVPLFLAADLDVFELDTDETMKEIGVWLGGTISALLVVVFWSQRRTARSALKHGQQMDERRRKRRQLAAQSQLAASTPTDATTSPGGDDVN